MTGLPKTLASSPGGTLIQSGTLATRPVAGVANRYYWASDIMEMYRDTGAAWELVALPMPFTHLRVGNWYSSPMIADSYGGATPISNNECWILFYPCRKTATYDRIGVDIQTLDAAGSYRLGIYADNGAGYPGALIRDAGACAVSAVGICSVALAPPVQLIAGRNYWLIFVSNTNIAQLYYTSNPGVAHNDLGHDTMIGRRNYGTISGVYLYGALADPCPAGLNYGAFGFAMGLRLLSVP